MDLRGGEGGVTNKIFAHFNGLHNYCYYLHGHSRGSANAYKVQVIGDIAYLQQVITATKCIQKVVLKV